MWAYRSYVKHGVLPCSRDRVAEKRAELERISQLSKATSNADMFARELELTRKELAAARAAAASAASSDFSAVNPISRSTFEPTSRP